MDDRKHWAGTMWRKLFTSPFEFRLILPHGYLKDGIQEIYATGGLLHELCHGAALFRKRVDMERHRETQLPWRRLCHEATVPPIFSACSCFGACDEPCSLGGEVGQPQPAGFQSRFFKPRLYQFCVSLSRRMWSVMWTKPFQVVSIVLFNAVVSLSPSLGHWVCLEAVVPSFGVWVRCRRTGQGRKEGTVWMF